jgi:hypothetical protein
LTERRAVFGEHCLTVVGQVGEALPSFSGLSPDITIGSPSNLDSLLRLASTALALRQIWSAFKNDVEDNRRAYRWIRR